MVKESFLWGRLLGRQHTLDTVLHPLTKPILRQMSKNNCNGTRKCCEEMQKYYGKRQKYIEGTQNYWKS